MKPFLPVYYQVSRKKIAIFLKISNFCKNHFGTSRCNTVMYHGCTALLYATGTCSCLQRRVNNSPTSYVTQLSKGSFHRNCHSASIQIVSSAIHSCTLFFFFCYCYNFAILSIWSLRKPFRYIPKFLRIIPDWQQS